MVKKLLLILAAIALISLFFVFAKNNQKLNPKTSSPNTPTASPSSQNNYQGTYLSFNYPSNFNLQKVTTTDGRVLENWLLTQQDDPNPTTVTISLFSSTKDLANFEPVQARRNNTSLYVEEVGRMKNNRGILFRTIDHKQRTIYFTNNHQILSLDYLAKTNDPTKEIEFQKFLEAINWE